MSSADAVHPCRALTRRAILYAGAHSLTSRCGLRTTWITFARPLALGMPPQHGTCRAASSLAPLPSNWRRLGYYSCGAW